VIPVLAPARSDHANTRRWLCGQDFCAAGTGRSAPARPTFYRTTPHEGSRQAVSRWCRSGFWSFRLNLACSLGDIIYQERLSARKQVMIMDPSDRQRFPRCTRLIATLDGSLPRKVRDAFVEACTAPIQRNPVAVARRIATTQALRFAAGPRVSIVSGLVRRPAGGQVVEVCGVIRRAILTP
jgi:hypothetical protein